MFLDYRIVERPIWWREGLPLPPLVASVCYTGSGQIGSGGRVVTTVKPLMWETISAWKLRTGL